MSLSINAIQNTRIVWKALFLREALDRIFGARFSWFWLFAEPVTHIAFFTFIFTVIRLRHVGGIETAVWIMIGMAAFFTFRRTAMQAMNAVDNNQSLFYYRQVQPVDAVLVRAGLEVFLMAIVVMLLVVGAMIFGYKISPENPLLILSAFASLWLFALGFGLIGSVIKGLVPEFNWVIKFLMRPLYFLSGIILPIASIQNPYREWLMLNPIAHGIEAARLGFAPYYHAAPELDLSYLWAWALIAVGFGLLLHRNYSQKLVMQ
jgi:capsular polysaccharide transport system permease protein